MIPSVERTSSSQAIADAHNLTVLENGEALPSSTSKPGSLVIFWAEMGTIFWMHNRLKYHRPLFLLIPISALLVYMLSVAFLYFQLPDTPEAAPSRRWVIILNTLYFTTTSNLQSFNFFEADRHNILPSAKDQAVGVRFSAASVWLGRYLAEMPFRIALVALATAIVYPIVGLRSGFGWALLYFMGFTLQTLGNGAFGMAISAAFPNPFIGAYAAVVGFSYNLLLSGAFYKSSTVTWILLWMRYLSVSFFVGQILVYDQFSGATYPNTPITGDDVLRVQGWCAESLSISIIGLICLILFYNVIGIFFLWLTSRPRLIKR